MTTFAATDMPVSSHKQNGAALVITIVVMLGLTVMALAATNSNQSQSIMVRNNQFRLEAFNISYAEIDAQTYAINKRKLSDGVPNYILPIIDGQSGDKTTLGVNDMAVLATTPNTYMTREVAHEFLGPCLVFGQEVGEGAEKIRCNELKLESEAKLVNTGVVSDQRQVYEYKTLN